jgi:hypothetical protein
MAAVTSAATLLSDAGGKQWQVTRWRDNKAFWWQSFPTEAEALEAAGA